MKTNAAVLWEYGAQWSIEDFDLDPPQDGEVLVSWEATGLCHSDEHVRVGDLPAPVPLIGGHEGAGIVQEVGTGVRGLSVGDHVVASCRHAAAADGAPPGTRTSAILAH
jgi:Zn-dependent alcohol dehydrogenase